MRTRTLIIWYGFVIFTSSACLLVLEITAGRLLAPYIGVSLYTWTSIIGVILAGLSLGNWIGGRWADAGGGERAVGIVLIAAGLASYGILLVLMLVAPWLQSAGFSLLGASFIYVLVLFFVPAVLLGVVTPLLTTLALGMDQRTGHIVGRMHALAAVGSIVGTFLTGYWLVQHFGTRAVIVGNAVVLLALGLPFLRRKAVAIALVVAVGTPLHLATQRLQGFANPCDVESLYYCLRTVDSSTEGIGGTARSMVLDHMMHSTNHREDPTLLLVPYVHAMDELATAMLGARRLADAHVFFAGGGAYTHPRYLRHVYPDARVVVAEIDPAVTRMARNRLFVSTQHMRVRHEDARMVLNQWSDEPFDLIVTDVFHDVAVPYHLTTHEFVQLASDHLKPDGLYLLNVVDVFPDPQLVKAMIVTLRRTFRYVDVWMESPPSEPTRLTYVLSASHTRSPPDLLQSRRGVARLWYRATEPLLNSGTTLAKVPVLTDDLAPVERLVSPLFFTEAGL